MRRWGMVATLHRRCCAFNKTLAPFNAQKLINNGRNHSKASYRSPLPHFWVPGLIWSAHLGSPVLARRPGALATFHISSPSLRNVRVWARKKVSDAAAASPAAGSEPLKLPTDESKPVRRPGRPKKKPAPDLTAESNDFAAPALSNASSEQPAAELETAKQRRRPRKQAAPGSFEEEADSASGQQLSAQTQIDLHADVPAGTHWQGVQSWVVFSDLHVSLKTADVACQVLRRVREEAEARNAGILFLGKLLLQSYKLHADGPLGVLCSPQCL